MTLESIKKCEILNELWTKYGHDLDFKDFIDYNDLGLPIAVLVAEEIMPLTPRAEIYLSETWDLFIAALDIEDKEYNTLDEMFFEAGRID